MLSENSKEARARAVIESVSPTLRAAHDAIKRSRRGIGAARGGRTMIHPEIGLLKDFKRLIEDVLRLMERAT